MNKISMRNYVATITRVVLAGAAVLLTADQVLSANPRSLSGVVQTGGTSSSQPLPDRMPPIAPEKYDGAQKKAAEEFLAARKEPVFGPFSVLIRSPELMNAYRTFGDYLRFKASVGNKLTEFIILVTAREWTQDFEWNFHVPLARKEGIGQDIIDAIADGRRPSGMSEDVEMCYNLVRELQRFKRVSDATYARAVKRFGEKGVLDIVGITGYYASLAMVMNTTRMSMPPSGKRLSRFPE